MDARKLPVDNPVHLFQFFHQVLFIVKPACGIAEQNVCPPCLRRAYRVKNHTGGICSLCAGDDINSRPVRPFRKLLAGRRPVGIRRRNQHFFSLSFQNTCQLSHRSGLANAVDANYQNYRLLLLKPVSGLVHPHLLLDAFNEKALAFRRLLDMVFLHLFLKPFKNLSGGVHTDVAHNQDFLKLLIKFLVDRGKSVENGIDSADDVISCLAKSLF